MSYALSNVIAYARLLAQTDSNGISDANGIKYANDSLFDFRKILIRKGVDAAQIQEAYRDASVVTSGQGSTFLYPSDMFFLKTIEINNQDTIQANYKTARQVDVSDLQSGVSYDYLRVNQAANIPLFDDHGDWYEVFPAFTSSMNVTRAIKVVYFLQPTEYTSTSDTISYPESLDYRILSFKMASLYLSSIEKQTQADVKQGEYLKRVDDLVNTISRGSEQPTQTQGIQLTGYEY